MTDPIVSIPHVIKDPLIGATLDRRYRVLGAIGQGATSSVYKAKDLRTDAVIAIKVSHLASDANLGVG
jgi:hypothetical protein